MTDKKQYWITNAAGEFALVEGAAERDTWTLVRGWRETEEPASDQAQVYVTHPDGLTGKLTYAATKGEWSGLGWKPGPPPMPRDLTRDPALTDVLSEPVQPREAPTPPKTPAAAGGDKDKE